MYLNDWYKISASALSRSCLRRSSPRGGCTLKKEDASEGKTRGRRRGVLETNMCVYTALSKPSGTRARERHTASKAPGGRALKPTCAYVHYTMYMLGGTRKQPRRILQFSEIAGEQNWKTRSLHSRENHGQKLPGRLLVPPGVCVYTMSGGSKGGVLQKEGLLVRHLFNFRVESRTSRFAKH